MHELVQARVPKVARRKQFDVRMNLPDFQNAVAAYAGKAPAVIVGLTNGGTLPNLRHGA